MDNVRVSFYVRKRQLKRNGKYPILARVSLDGERTTLGRVGLDLDSPSELSNNKVADPEKQAQLELIVLKIQSLAEKLWKVDNLNLSSLKNSFLNTSKKRGDTISSLFDDHLDKIAKKYEANLIAACTRNKWNRSKKLFFSFLAWEYHRRDIQVSELTTSMVRDYEDYLFEIQGFEQNTVSKYMQLLKTISNIGLEKRLLTHDPFKGVKLKRIPSKIGFLTEEEIDKLHSLELPSMRLELVRDMFFFSCYTGLAYADAVLLNQENIHTIKGTPWIIQSRKKTGTEFKVPLLPPAIAILRKYAEQVDIDGNLLPMISNQKMNQYLKEIGELSGIKKKLTYHLARHSFATLACTKGVTIESISKMLGHKNPQITKIYAKITSEKVSEEMKEFKELMKDKKTWRVG